MTGRERARLRRRLAVWYVRLAILATVAFWTLGIVMIAHDGSRAVVALLAVVPLLLVGAALRHQHAVNGTWFQLSMPR